VSVCVLIFLEFILKCIKNIFCLNHSVLLLCWWSNHKYRSDFCPVFSQFCLFHRNVTYNRELRWVKCVYIGKNVMVVWKGQILGVLRRAKCDHTLAATTSVTVNVCFRIMRVFWIWNSFRDSNFCQFSEAIYLFM